MGVRVFFGAASMLQPDLTWPPVLSWHSASLWPSWRQDTETSEDVVLCMKQHNIRVENKCSA